MRFLFFVMKIAQIISGGQTGADRAALDFALDHAIPCAGWCPKGRVAEDGEIPAKYPLLETQSADYPERTRKNVNESNATVIFDSSKGKQSRGTKLAVTCCEKSEKPYLILNGFPDVVADGTALAAFLAGVSPCILNIAGNRESGTPGMHQHVYDVLDFVRTSSSG